MASQGNDISPPDYPDDEEKQRDKPQQIDDGKAYHGDKGDPFGDETNAEVKYKSMSWW